MTTDKQFDILHDHYKDTFARIRDAERSRDRLFIWVIALYALLSLEIGYPAALSGSLGSVSIAGATIDLQNLPLPALLNATWVLTLAIALRYCQGTIFVERQYPYLHMLERTISGLLRAAPLDDAGKPSATPQLDPDIYQREGHVYLNEYPLLLNVTWFAYVILFPLIVIGATSALVAVEWAKLPYPLVHRSFDTIIAIAIVICFYLYQMQPRIAAKWNKRRKAREGYRQARQRQNP